jgi:hypothetical protein
MTTHKVKSNDIYTLCGLDIFCVPIGDRITLEATSATCPNCIKQIGGHGSKENKASTYTSLPIQPWHFAEANNLSFLEGCIIKRICRHWRKGGIEDLDKAIDEIEKLKKHRYNVK